ncbi:MAG: signal peptide peptidase SppA [Candidatus Dadabacteria bacterium]|nr:signal peptide peptidase SppA [Candidatus Dadabacteria bacterium]
MGGEVRIFDLNFFLKTFLSLVVIFLIAFAGMVIGMLVSGQDQHAGGDGLAVINIDGVIIDSEPYIKSIRKIRETDSVKAVVVRINSPGGAVATSQEIYEEIRKLGETMPVVASMGTVAASGGYYVACAASAIYANPGTITGSIGVIAQFASYEQLLKWAKLEVEVIKSGEFKDLGSPLRKMPEAERVYLQTLIDSVHVQFKDTVSQARSLAPQKVDSLSDGRIFTGSQARDLGLVDHIGTLEVAIAEARELGGLDQDSWIREYPMKKKTLLDFVFPETVAKRVALVSPVKTGFGLYYIADMAY